MHIIATELAGAYLIEPDRRCDERGYFARLWCQRTFADRGLNPNVVQSSIAHSDRSGTLRGLHYQASPHAEAKLVRCIRGAIYDVIVDLRPESPTYLRWTAFALDASRGVALYVPELFAHGYQTREPQTEVLYQMSTAYHPQSERGIRWNDPLLAIDWPEAPSLISAKDRSYADFKPAQRAA